jgi:hypothetical protein
LLSRIRYFLKPRQRIWDQEGLSELVTITVPKKEELRLTKDLSQTEVQSRLKALATTLDTRGWAVKNIDVNLSALDTGAQMVTPDSDRLVGAGGVPKQMAVVDVHAEDDIMDEKNNPTAKKFDSLMKQAEEKRKRSLLASLKGLVSEELGKPPTSKITGKGKHAAASKKSHAGLTEEEKRILHESEAEAKQELQKKLSKARAQFNSRSSASKAKPAVRPAQSAKVKSPQSKPVTPDSQSVKMELAQSGNAFSVATLSQLANRGPKIEQTGPD